jgi:uncharacterized protein YjiS (DUF1127 family)
MSATESPVRGTTDARTIQGLAGNGRPSAEAGDNALDDRGGLDGRGAALTALLAAVRERRAEFEAQRQISDDVIEMMKAVGICRSIGQSIGRAFEGALRLAGRGLVTLMDWHDIAKERRALRSMSDEMLNDIGISRTDAMREASRRFWDVDQPRGSATE